VIDEFLTVTHGFVFRFQSQAVYLQVTLFLCLPVSRYASVVPVFAIALCPLVTSQYFIKTAQQMELVLA